MRLFALSPFFSVFLMNAFSLAVLPFANISPDPADVYFSDGITEEIIQALARIKGLKVTSRTSSFYFKDKALPLTQIAQQLGVSTILEGSVRRVGNMLRVTAQLVHAVEDAPFWVETWDRSYDNLFAVQDEISLLIADQLREQMGHFDIQDHLVAPVTENMIAHDLSLQARYLFNRWNPQDIREAIRLYEKVLSLDASHVDALVGLADAYGFMATTEFMPRVEAWQLAAAYTEKALAIQPTHPGAHYQLANISLFVEMDYHRALHHTHKALEYMPGYAEARLFIAFLHLIAGELAETRKQLDQALALDPLSMESRFYEAYYFYAKGDMQTSLHKAEECLRDNPLNLPAYVLKVFCLLISGQYEASRELAENMPPEIAIESEQRGIVCLSYILEKDPDKTAAWLQTLKEAAEDNQAFQDHAYLLLAYSNLGERDSAFAWLDKLIKMKSTVIYISFMAPLNQALRADARFDSYRARLFPTLPPSQQQAPKSHLLDEAETARYAEHLLSFMQEERPYLNPALSLRALAGMVDIHPNQLSWLINTHLGKNFNEFVNQYRVQTFKKLALDPANSHISLLGLAYESGFHSKSVFNTHFKRMVGMTPSAFVKMQQGK